MESLERMNGAAQTEGKVALWAAKRTWLPCARECRLTAAESPCPSSTLKLPIRWPPSYRQSAALACGRKHKAANQPEPLAPTPRKWKTKIHAVKGRIRVAHGACVEDFALRGHPDYSKRTPETLARAFRVIESACLEDLSRSDVRGGPLRSSRAMGCAWRAARGSSVPFAPVELRSRAMFGRVL
jgi:hypothetical protein